MKRRRIVGACLALLTLSVAGGWAWGDIKGSKHDFADKSWAGDDLCGVCHTPHRDQPPKAAPLWDLEADLSERFGKPAAGSTGPGLGTRICLHCHDGTVAREAVTGAVRERYGNTENPGLFGLGHDATDHPVGVAYPQFDKGFHAAATVTARGTVALPDGKVECISCHDPHSTSGVTPMLVTSNTRSALCLTCHKK